jgi:hypothetical protein
MYRLFFSYLLVAKSALAFLEPICLQKGEDVIYGYNTTQFAAVECGFRGDLVRFSLTKLNESYDGWIPVLASRRQVNFIFKCPDEYSIVDNIEDEDLKVKGLRLRLKDLGPKRDDIGFNMM